jgi:hypothetical protein
MESIHEEARRLLDVRVLYKNLITAASRRTIYAYL